MNIQPLTKIGQNSAANVANVAKRHFAALLSIKPHFATHCQSTQKVRQNFAAPFAALCQYETSLPRFFAALFSIYSKTIDWEGFKKKNTSALYCTLCGKLPWKPHHKYYPTACASASKRAALQRCGVCTVVQVNTQVKGKNETKFVIT